MPTNFVTEFCEHDTEVTGVFNVVRITGKGATFVGFNSDNAHANLDVHGCQAVSASTYTSEATGNGSTDIKVTNDRGVVVTVSLWGITPEALISALQAL